MTTSQNPTSHPTPCCDRCDFLNETRRLNDTPVDESYSPRHAKKTPLVGKLRDLLSVWKSEHPAEIPPVEETLRKMAETSTAGLAVDADGNLDAVEIPTVSKQFVERSVLASDLGPSYITGRVRGLTHRLLWNKAAADVPAGHYLGALSFCSGVEQDVESDTYELVVVMTATYGPVSSVPGESK